MDSNDYLKAKDQLKKGYKRQLQDLVMQGCVFFNVFQVEEWVREVTYAAAPPDSVSDQDSTEDTPFRL